MIDVARFVGWMLGAFVGMEILSYGLHRWVFHGPLWRIHASHHQSRPGRFEANDVFAIFFSAVAIALLIIGLDDPIRSIPFPIGLGMTAYGFSYFVVHDLLTHKRFAPVTTKIGWLNAVRRAHLRHHQNAAKPGWEPFGLFLFPYKRFRTEEHADPPEGTT